MRLTLVEICARAWLGGVAGQWPQGETVLAFYSTPLRMPEGWFVELALGVVLLGAGLVAWCIHRRRLGASGAKRAGDLYEAIFHAMPYPAFCKDARGSYLAVNRAYEEAFGIEARRLLGRDLSQTRHLGLDCQRTHAAHLRIIRAAVPVSDEVVVADARHGARPFRLQLTPLRASAGGAALLGTCVAAAGRHDARCAGDAALDYALLTAISHDIRTPLTGIIGTLELLGYAELSTRQRALVDTAEQASRNLQSILDDVLALAKLETGAVPRDPHPFDLRALVAEVLAAHRLDPAPALSLDERIAPLHMGDGSGLRQALDKLLVHFQSRRLGRAPQLRVRVLAQGAQWQSIELALAAPPAPVARGESSGRPRHGDELAWISACKLCEWIGFALQEQGDGGPDPCFVMRGRLALAAHGAGAAGDTARPDPRELAGLAHEDAIRVERRLAEVFGADASAADDYLQLIRNEEARLLANLECRDVQRLREVAHYLCGMGAFFGAQRLSELACAVEQEQEAEDLLRHAQILGNYLTDFIDSLRRNLSGAAEFSINTTVLSDMSHGNASGPALEL